MKKCRRRQRKAEVVARELKPTREHPISTREILAISRKFPGMRLRYKLKCRAFFAFSLDPQENGRLHQLLQAHREQKIYV